MTWLEQLRRIKIGGVEYVGASFRGKPFLVDVSKRTGGRRTMTHEYPLRDEPFVEDLGRRARTFPVEGYVVGDDYMAQRDSLIAALEGVEGPGELVHPYYGVRRAICTNLSVTESRQDGGMAVFSIEFSEAPAQGIAPTIEVDSPAKVATSAGAAHAATKAELVSRYSVVGLPSHALASVERSLRSAASRLGDALAPVVGVAQELAAMAAQIQLIKSTASSLVRDPAGLVDTFRGAITELGSTLPTSPGAMMSALLEAYSFDTGSPVSETTATRRQEAANQRALAAALQRTLAIEAARLAPLVPYVSIDEALAARERIAAILEDQAATADDTAYPALVTLRSEVLRAVPGGEAYARVVTHIQRVPISVGLLSYKLYGTVAMEDDIIARNGISHPGFVVGELKVLSNAK